MHDVLERYLKARRAVMDAAQAVDPKVSADGMLPVLRGGNLQKLNAALVEYGVDIARMVQEVHVMVPRSVHTISFEHGLDMEPLFNFMRMPSTFIPIDTFFIAIAEAMRDEAS